MNKREIKWKYNIGDRIVCKTINTNKKNDLTITNREIRQNIKKKKNKDYNYFERYYEYKCNICGAEHLWKREIEIEKSICSCCSGNIRIKGINTFGDLYPEHVKYFDNDDAFNPMISSNTRYNMKCPICGKRKMMRVSHLLDQNFFCDHCNSIGIKRPDLIKYFVNKEDAFKITYGSGKKVLLRCPECKSEKYMTVSQLNQNGFSCKKCSDGISYPEKFIMHLLSQLNVEFERQASSNCLKWCNDFKYDFYIKNKNMIIETHGIQHYTEDSELCQLNRMAGRDEKENDKKKEDLAKENNISHYVVLDCRKSELEWIKESVLNSELNKLYDLSKIDWKECAIFATKNIYKDVCEYWNKCEIKKTSYELSKIFHIGKTTVIKYLKMGSKLGLCDYDPKEEIKKSKKKIAASFGRKVSIWKNDICIGVFESMSELEEKSISIFGVQLRKSGVWDVCQGKCKTHKGFVFKYENT